MDVLQIKKQPDQIFEITTNSGTIYKSLSVIISTGAQSLWLNAKNEETYKGYFVLLFNNTKLTLINFFL